MIEKFEIHSREIADRFLAALVANDARLADASFHADDKIHDPHVRDYFLDRARQVLQA
ncbi:hypothetical protein ACS0OQ_13440 [Stenotrophomonas riyadhensis]|uniref:hypothetical protein n=1 Tax=Stenotrophomonas riyadhensis TaxID=2859893 RepID=UPI003F9C332E